MIMNQINIIEAAEHEQIFKDAAEQDPRLILNELGDELAEIAILLSEASTSAHSPRVYAAYQAVLDEAAARYAKRMLALGGLRSVRTE